MDPIYSQKGQRPERKKNLKKNTEQGSKAVGPSFSSLHFTLNIILLQRAGEQNPPTLLFFPCAQYSGEDIPPPKYGKGPI